ncbi:MAG: bifunctional UDP-N-acetylglucosamine diphosphorylase/glucosamine-1-phosphate N-acetyltransferase GlmU [Acidaminococcales bacterium]|nr:bifunctional UDP-N-acetylglucosamine diphosphorylase/glucosamine-1-phosphate N-acetyltransferase GlmU [Acidaminococcales bacterium]
MSMLAAVILAAGKGTRMKSELPKVLHCVAGLPMLSYVLEAAEAAGCARKIVVIGFGAGKVAAIVEGQAELAEQKAQLGTGHAVMQAKPLLSGFDGTVMILCGDTPLLDGRELRRFYEHHIGVGNKATVLTAVLKDASGYGRIVRGGDGRVAKIVEQKDADIQELAIKEINTGIYCFDGRELFSALETVGCDNAQGEYYLTDVIARLVEKGAKVGAVAAADKDTVMGVNSRRDLAAAEKWMRMKTNCSLMDEGVTIIDPDSTYIDTTAIIGRDTIVRPNTWIEGNTVVGKDCVIGPNVRLSNTQVGDGSVLHFTYAHDAAVGRNANIGPFVHIRPGTRLADDVKVGNFVEVKNSWVGKGSKLPHLTYVGDADIGENVNMGCGTVTVNYDGKKKYRTKIGDNAFVGCNANLIAPVELGENCYVAAGSTINKEVPPDALGIARTRQQNIENWKRISK